jgi:uncharacterized protein YbbK (DUF523 family)
MEKAVSTPADVTMTTPLSSPHAGPRLLVSACLLGQRVRYDGQAKPFAQALLDQWLAERRVVALCPEVAAGFKVPRPPAEIAAGCGGADVLAGRATVSENTGNDVTRTFLDAARIAVETARREACALALLTDGSPACGSSYIYSGQHDGSRRPGQGVVAAALRQIGVEVFAQGDFAALTDRMAAGPAP